MKIYVENRKIKKLSKVTLLCEQHDFLLFYIFYYKDYYFIINIKNILLFFIYIFLWYLSITGKSLVVVYNLVHCECVKRVNYSVCKLHIVEKHIKAT